MAEENWLTFLDAEDRAELFAELRATVGAAEASGDITHVETCLRAWRTTARARSDPAAREVLLTAKFAPEDFVEVQSPGGQP